MKWGIVLGAGIAFFALGLYARERREVRVGLATLLGFLPYISFTINPISFETYRGDTRGLYRIEYSVPITKWRFFAFRALGFWDTGYMAFRNPRETDRVYLPNQREGVSYWRNDVGAGIRVYVKAIVLPLLGLDVGYGIEAKSPEVYFQLGLTDF